MSAVIQTLFALKDSEYRDFQARLIPTVSKDTIIGVRVPQLRKVASNLIKNNAYGEFFEELPHKYYDENMLHSILISKIKDFDKAMKATDDFLPFIDNWAVCDTLSPKVFSENKKELLNRIKNWCDSKETYTCRFGIKMLMSHFLDKDFKPEYLSIPAKIKSDEYYVNMMIAWYYATALAKKWDQTIPYIDNRTLEQWIHNKTIRKSIESLRVTPEQKSYLRKKTI